MRIYSLNETVLLVSRLYIYFVFSFSFLIREIWISARAVVVTIASQLRGWERKDGYTISLHSGLMRSAVYIK